MLYQIVFGQNCFVDALLGLHTNYASTLYNAYVCHLYDLFDYEKPLKAFLCYICYTVSSFIPNTGNSFGISNCSTLWPIIFSAFENILRNSEVYSPRIGTHI